MFRPTWTLSLMTLLTATALAACGDSGGTSDTDATASETNPTSTATDGSSGGSGSSGDTPTTGGGGDTAADGEACGSNDDCASVACEKYRDAEAGTCVAAPPGGATRVTGTIIDFTTGAAAGSVDLKVVGALAVLTDPVNAKAVAMGTSDASGKVDFVSAAPVKEGIGLIGLVTGGSFYLTATGLASPGPGNAYGPMTTARDIWGVPSAKLTEWTTMLMADADVAASLPLGEKGGVIGLVREGATGAAKAGAVIVPVAGTTGAKIRYLADDGMSFNSTATGTSGIFILLGPSVAEEFSVEGSPDVTGKAGSAPNVAFVMTLNL